MSKKTQSYPFDEFIKYRNVNNMMPQKLVPYCVDHHISHNSNVDSFTNEMASVISSITAGNDPNAIVFKNLVKTYINKIHKENYQEYLQKLQALDLTTSENLRYLGSELLMCALRCPLSVNGFATHDKSVSSIPEICVDVIKYFTSNQIFHSEIIKTCQQYFYEFVSINKSLDENNENTSDNYKGFMTVMGLLYSRGVINIKVVIDCIGKIKRTIFCSDCSQPSAVHDDSHTCYKTNISEKITSKICYHDCNKCDISSPTNVLTTRRNHVECINLHKGYEYLMTQVIASLEVRINDLIVKFKSAETEDSKTQLMNTFDKVCEYLDMILTGHQEFMTLNQQYKTLNKNQLVMPFKPYIVLTHNGLGESLNKLYDLIGKHHPNKFNTKYVVISFAK